MSAPTDLPPGVTRGKTSAELGRKPTDPRDLVPLIQRHVGLAEGELHIVRQLVRALDSILDGDDVTVIPFLNC